MATELQLALFALFFSVKTETNAQIITLPVELHTTVDLSCRCPIYPESTVAVQWYRSSNPDVFVKDGKALAWWYERDTGSSQGFGITDDFSMIWYSVNLTNEGLYRCIVIPVDGARCTHDAKLGIYANPDRSPVIEYIRENNGFNVTCSISNVFPMTFPILTTEEGNGTAYINRDGTYNTDGTFNTTVTHWFPANDKDTTIECLYSNLNFTIVSCLRIVDNYIIDQPKERDRMQNNMTQTDSRCTPSGLWMVWTILIIEVLFVIVIAYAITKRRVIFDPARLTTIGNSTYDMDRDEHPGKNSEEEEPVESTKILQLLNKLSCGVATLTIQITTVLILSIAYIATVSGYYKQV